MVRLVLNGKQRSDCSQARHGNYSFHVCMSPRSLNPCSFSFSSSSWCLVFMIGCKQRQSSMAHVLSISATDLECYRSRCKPRFLRTGGPHQASQPSRVVRWMHFGSQTKANRFPFKAHHRVASSIPYNRVYICSTSSTCEGLERVTFRRRGPSAFDLW
jgi:hypothetical protein